MIEKAPKLNKIEMVRSDVSGKLFPMDECEMVIIRIVKGKNEDINEYNPIVKEPVARREAEHTIVPAGFIPKTLVDEHAPINYEDPKVMKSVSIARSIVPRNMQDLFNDPNKLV
jgi:hypothetical protein